MRGWAVSYHKEKRQRPRAKVSWPVVIRTDQGDISGETLNITVDGALVRCQKLLEPNETIEMLIQIPALVRPLTVPGQVIHCNVNDEGGEATSYEVGVRFTEVSEKNKWLISTAVQRESGVMLMP